MLRDLLKGFLSIFLLILVACGSSPSTLTPTVSAPPTVAPTASFTATASLANSPLSQLVTLTSHLFSSGNLPDYTFTAQAPALSGSLDPRVINFNHAMAALVQALMDEFSVNQKGLPADPTLPKSFLDVRFDLISPPGNIYSLKFEITTYVKGAAHPNEYSRTTTYDLEKGEEVTLAQLFLPGVDYLGPISEYCLAQLSASPIGAVLDFQGAQPSLKNYRNWNVSAAGLVITFDPYQVAAYAAGSQVVVIPYVTLEGLLDPNGPLTGILP